MARKGPIITQAWLQDFYANNVVKSKYKGSLKNKKRNQNVKKKR